LSRFDRLVASKEKERRSPDFDTVEIGGVFACQQCDETVEVALYSNRLSTLAWKCPAGHKSFMEDVHL
jgi:hypothetical protein